MVNSLTFQRIWNWFDVKGKSLGLVINYIKVHNDKLCNRCIKIVRNGCMVNENGRTSNKLIGSLSTQASQMVGNCVLTEFSVLVDNC